MALRKCSWCDRKFTKPEHLMRHERSHTRERPYVCNICNKTFSRSDVLYRHTKVHTRKARNGRRSAAASQDGISFHETVVLTPSPQTLQLYEEHSESSPFPSQLTMPQPSHTGAPGDLPICMDGMTQAPDDNNRGISIAAGLNEGQTNSNAEIMVAGPPSAEPLLVMSSQSPVPQVHSELNEEHFMNSAKEPSITAGNVTDDVLALEALDTSANLDGWALDLAQNSWPFQNNFHDFPASPLSYHMPTEGLGPSYTPSQCKETQYSPSESPSSVTSQIPLTRFTQVERCWQPPSMISNRLTPNLWEDIIQSKSDNIYCDFNPPDPNFSPIRQGRFQWEFDDDCLGRLQAEVDAVTAPVPWTTRDAENSFALTIPSMGDNFSYCTGNSNNITWPSPEVFSMALEMYFCHFHPESPLIHIPTFFIKQASPILLLVTCLIGFNLLGTAGAKQFIAQVFPSALQLVSQELGEASKGLQPRKQQLSAFTASLLMLHLAFISGDRTKVAQTEVLYLNLLTVTQIRGLFSCDESPSADRLENEIPDINERWKAWARIECVKHLIIRLVEIDCWFAAELSISPTVRPDIVRIVPPSDIALFNAPSSSKWNQLVNNNKSVTKHSITPSFIPTRVARLDSNTLHSILTLVHLSVYKVHYRLITLEKRSDVLSSSETSEIRAALQPWSVYNEDPRGHRLVQQITGLITLDVDSLGVNELNTTILWHSLCLMLGANLTVFELAAGRSGAEPAQRALDDIMLWSKTPAARRSCLHAAHIFKLLVHRRVSEIVSINSVLALFYSALVLGLHILTMGDSEQDGDTAPLELCDDIDWASIGNAGLSDRTDYANNFASGKSSQVVNFICSGGQMCMAGTMVEGGYEPARRFLLHCADLMDGIGRGKSRSFSQILHIMSDDLTDVTLEDNQA